MFEIGNWCFTVHWFIGLKSTVKRKRTGTGLGTISGVEAQGDAGLGCAIPVQMRLGTKLSRNSR